MSLTFPNVIERAAKKGIIKGNSRFPKPDILVILTDCEFVWPWLESGKLPYSCATIIIVSVVEYDEVKCILPRWVKNKKNFISIENVERD